MVYERSVRSRDADRLKSESVSDGRTNQLTGVGAGDAIAYAFEKIKMRIQIQIQTQMQISVQM